MKYFEKYNVEMNEETMIIKITMDSPRSRMGYKMIAHIRFKTVARMHEWFVQEWFASMEKQINAKAAAQAKVKQARATFVNPYKVGQILYGSWGYDQTNINFYQITALGPMSVKMVPIGQNYIRPAGFDCEYVTANPENILGEEFTKKIILDRSGQPYIRSPYRGTIRPWDGQEKYQSHYA